MIARLGVKTHMLFLGKRKVLGCFEFLRNVLGCFEFLRSITSYMNTFKVQIL